MNSPPSTLPPEKLGRTFSLHRRFALLLACMLAALWLAVAWDNYKTEQDAHEQMRQQTAALAMAFADHTEATFQRADHLLLQLREFWLANPETFADAIAREQTLLGDTIIQIGVINADGYLIYSNLAPMSTPVDLSDREHFKVHRDAGQADRLFISRPVKGRVSGKWSIQLTRPIFDGGRFAGVLVLSLDPGYFVRYYQRFNLGTQGIVSIVRDSGEIMALAIGQAQDGMQYIGKVISTAPVTDAGAALQGSYHRSTSLTDGTERLFSYYHLPERGVSVRIGAGVNDYLTPVRAQQRTAWLIAGAVTLVLVWLSWLLLRGLARLETAESVVTKDRQRLANIVWGTGVGTWEWNVQTGETRFNERWAELVGYTLDELTPINIDTWMRLAHPDDLAKSGALLERHFAGEIDHYDFEARMRHKDGHWVWVLDRGKVVSRTPDGQPEWMAGTHSDISERKQAEHALHQKTDALARSNAELEQFAYVASHDLRQPLRMVNSYVQLLERRLADKLDAETREMMHFATDGAKRLDQMLVSLLEYSRVGRKGEPLAPLASRSGVDEALRFLVPAINEANATVRVSGDWPEVVASRDEFTRLWQNLIGNAVKYRAPERNPEIDITVTPEADGWRFCVTDNGIGIEPTQFDRLFKVFQRLHTREQYEGTGIGLAVARKIVERHGGRIWVESGGIGLGCRFCFNLPQTPPSEALL